MATNIVKVNLESPRTVDSIAALEALNVSRQTGAVYLDAAGRSGWFKWDSSDLSTEVSNDTEQGIYVAPSSDATGASGAWVRDYDSVRNILWYGVSDSGTLSNTELQAAATHNSGGTVYLPPGTYNFTAFPTGIDDVTFIGTPGTYTWSDKELPMDSGVFTGGRKVALVSAVVRYYATGPNGGAAGWYLLNDFSGGNHDPILVSRVSNMVSDHITLKIAWADFGVDPAVWTPSGVVVGPDETLARENVVVGARAGADFLWIEGRVAEPSTFSVVWSSASGAFVVSDSSSFTATWLNDSTSSARLKVETTSNTRTFYTSNILEDEWVVTSRNRLNNTFTYHAQGQTISNTAVEIYFFDASGTHVNTPDPQMAVNIMTNQKLRTLPWTSFPDQYGNLWVIGAFTRKESSLSPGSGSYT